MHSKVIEICRYPEDLWEKELPEWFVDESFGYADYYNLIENDENNLRKQIMERVGEVNESQTEVIIDRDKLIRNMEVKVSATNEYLDQIRQIKTVEEYVNEMGHILHQLKTIHNDTSEIWAYYDEELMPFDSFVERTYEKGYTHFYIGSLWDYHF